ncbi:phage minor head protein [Azospirillum halopraeferens]|uniref:phage head morphogenesis protein n=1 Tax=Azospirillum halopraeferens TaxID=34010 RepID=UPI00040421F2|nr:phage minor head protein [Azospirillum halopraeferens]
MAAYSEKPGFGFPTGPDAETLAYLKAKGWAPAFSHKDVRGDEHAFAFTVAKATQMDVLRTIREELERAQAAGEPFDAFRRRVTPRLIELGWWGEGEVEDPKAGGAKRPGQLGSPRRLKTIFEANIRTAHAAGQWARIERTKDVLPYLVYELGPSERHRPEHASKKGLLLPVDSPFWRAWMPPNGWGCKCRVRQVSAAEARRRGWDVSAEPDVPMRQWTNDRRGETIDVPVGIDPGWANNPGLTRRRNLDALTVDKLAAAPADLARAAIADMVAHPRFADWLDRPDGWFPVARLPDEVAAAIGARTPVAVLSPDTMAKQKGELPGRPGHPELTLEEYRTLPFLGGDPQEVIRNAERTVVVIRRDGALYLAAVKADAEGNAVFVSSFRRTNARDVDRERDRGRVIWKEGRAVGTSRSPT